jgi:hypothetical protein
VAWLCATSAIVALALLLVENEIDVTMPEVSSAPIVSAGVFVSLLHTKEGEYEVIALNRELSTSFPLSSKAFARSELIAGLSPPCKPHPAKVPNPVVAPKACVVAILFSLSLSQ